MLIPRPYQQAAHDAVVEQWRKTREPVLVEAATGCHEHGHPILMADGSIKPVQDILVGDYVMGADSTPREVLELHRGEQEMFKITPVKGDAFIVNGGHILSLYCTPRRKGDKPSYAELSVFEYTKKSDHFKHIHKLERCAVSFDSKEVEVPPYILGLLIGDACLARNMISFSNENLNIMLEVKRWAESIGCTFNYLYCKIKNCYLGNITDHRSTRKVRNRATATLSKYGLIGKKSIDKYIPFEYLANSVDCRLDVIAGLLDTDGSLSNGGYDWISKSERLAEDMVYLCRSVGLAAYKKETVKKCQTMQGVYYRVHISGDCSIIPMKVDNKKPHTRKQIKRVNVTGFNVDPVGVGEYYGFTITGDHLYLDGHFIRHHNSGKSIIVALLARTLHNLSGGKRVLCLQPTSDLVEQNVEKYKAIGEKCSIYSASISKSLRHQVIFATELTFKSVAKRLAHEFAGVIIDEAHRITPTVKGIVDDLREGNENLRVCGLSATPYRLGTGYVYAVDEHDRALHESVCKDPYFHKLVYAIRARDLIKEGFLTPLRAGAINTSSYDTDGLKVQSNGSFSNATVKAAFEGWGRKTASIIADVVAQTQNSRGVMIFAATVQHAEEVMASLHPDNARMIGGKINTKRSDRRKLVNDFRAQKFTYLVSVGTMTTGVDFTHVDTVAVLRATESISLLQQILGRSMRLHDGKNESIVLDYANNLERHCPDGDLYRPEVKARVKTGESEPIECRCPDCSRINVFSPRKEALELDMDEYGYLVGLDGTPVLIENHQGEYVPMPAHFGRRCQHIHLRTGDRCDYYWTSKQCPVCEHHNDITARYCESCKLELINPNDKLLEMYHEHKKDPTKPQCEKVVDIEYVRGISSTGNDMITANVFTESRKATFYLTEANSYAARIKEFFSKNTNEFTELPRTIRYKKDGNFWKALAFNQPTDNEVLQEKLRQ